MKILTNINDICHHFFNNPESYKDDASILVYAPYCANQMMNMQNSNEDRTIFADLLQKMFQNHPYAIPFYYISFLMQKSTWNNAETCKSYLRDICADLDKIIPWYKEEGFDEEYLNQLKPLMTQYLIDYVNNIRYIQKETGANESVMGNYAPIVPYGIGLKKQDLEASEYLDQNMIADTMNNKSKLSTTQIAILGIKNCRAIIDNINIMINWKCCFDMFSSLSRCRWNNDTFRYLANIYLYTLDEDIDLVKQYSDYCVFTCHQLNPLKPDEFAKVFESMMTYNVGNIDDMMTTEAWTALQDISQEYSDTFLKGVINKMPEDTYDLDALLAQFYTMRHIETNDYTNQYFLSNFPGIKVNSYNYINNNIMICEINEKYLAIPYVDIAADYNVHMITINKDGIIKIWNDENMQRLTRIDPEKEKGED